MSVSKTESNKLFGLAQNRCAFEDKEVLTLKEDTNSYIIGEIAHIVARSPDGPRGDPNFPKDKLDKYENLILLCPTCHKKIDKNPDKYPVEMLYKIKKEHEEWAYNQLEVASAKYGLEELKIAADGIKDYIESGKYTTGNFEVITPDEKIEKNNLTAISRGKISLGLRSGNEVEMFFSEISKYHPKFIEKLTIGFKSKYSELIEQGLYGDSLFEGMVEFAQCGSRGDIVLEAASLGILCHLFEICEVFEK